MFPQPFRSSRRFLPGRACCGRAVLAHGVAVLGLLLIMVPQIDLTVSGWFYLPGHVDPMRNFLWRGAGWADAAHQAIQWLSRGAGVGVGLAFLYTLVRRRRVLGLDRLAWLFLGLSLAVGPGLTANYVFKEHWGRARPSQIEQFGGQARHSPPLVLSDQCHHNCAFVAGDPAAMFWLHSLAYVLPGRRARRRVLAAGVLAGAGAGLLRVAQGAHFFSDVLFGGAFMLLVSAGLHAAFYGRSATAALWREWLGPS